MMREVVVQILGEYHPIDGCADWSYIGGVLLFTIAVAMALYAFCGVLKK